MKGGALHADDPPHDTLPIEYMSLSVGCFVLYSHAYINRFERYFPDVTTK